MKLRSPSATAIARRHVAPQLRLGILGLLSIASTFAAAQASPPTSLPDAPSAQQQPQAEPHEPPPSPNETDEQRRVRLHAQAGREVKVEETQRIAVVVPNFNTVITGRAVPLSRGQKTDLALHSTFDPFNFVGAAFNSGLSEINGTHRGFGWGPAGYAKRYGANLADVFDGTMLAGAVYPILLRQDPRFFRQGAGTFGSRIRHALAASVVCRGDNGRSQPNFSNVLGNFTSGLISNAYYPSNETGIGLSLVNSTIQTAEGAAGNIALEFSPDVDAYLQRRRERKALARQPASPPQLTPPGAHPPGRPAPGSSPSSSPHP